MLTGLSDMPKSKWHLPKVLLYWWGGEGKTLSKNQVSVVKQVYFVTRSRENKLERLSLESLESLVYSVYEWSSQVWWSIFLCLSLYGWASTVLKNIRLGCKGSPGTNTLAYFPKLQNRDKSFGLLKACYE
jgi:hypothetical protein